MPHTYRDYSLREVAILVRGYYPLPTGHERACEGDILVIRKPHPFVGKKEMSRYLWLRIEGLDINEMDLLIHNLQEGETRLDKRRYCIPLDRLKEVAPWLDLDQVRNPNIIHQPFLQVDEETGYRIGTVRPALDVHGLVYDKVKRRFL